MGFFAPLYCHFVNYFFVATAIFFVPTAIFFCANSYVFSFIFGENVDIPLIFVHFLSFLMCVL